MEIEIGEIDYEKILARSDISKVTGHAIETLGNEVEGDFDQARKKIVLDALPKVLAKKMEEIMPKNWEIKEIVLKVNVAGKPFGIGLEGDASVKFGPKPATGP